MPLNGDANASQDKVEKMALADNTTGKPNEEADETEVEEEGLTQLEIDYCYQLESEEQSAQWERPLTEDELAEVEQSPTGKACHACGSRFHLIMACPLRLKMVQERTHQCKALDIDSSWEDVASEQELYPTLDLDIEDWAGNFTESIRRFHGFHE